MAAEEIINKNVVGIGFGFYSGAEIKRLSVKRITVPFSYDALDNPVPNGFYDTKLGATKNFENCATCGLTMNECPGHLGHVELSVPVYNLTLMPLLVQLIRCKCMACHYFRIGRVRMKKFLAILKCLACGMSAEARRAEAVMLQRDRMRANMMGDGKAIKKSSKSKSAAAAAAAKPKKKKKAGSEFVDAEAMDADEEESSADDEDALPGPDDHLKDDKNDDPAAPIELSIEQQLDEIIALADERSAELALEQQQTGSAPLVTRYTTQDLDFRRHTVGAFLKAMPGRRCENCKAYSPGFRKDGFTKIFKVPLNDKQRKLNEALDIVIPDVTQESAPAFTERLSQRVTQLEAERKAKRDKSAKAKKQAKADEKGEADADADDADDAADDGADDELELTRASNLAAGAGAPAPAGGAGSDNEEIAVPIGTSKAEKKRLQKEAADLKKQTVILFPNEIETHMKLLWERDRDILDYLYGQKRPGQEPVQDHSMFFVSVLPVPPSRFRLPSFVAGKAFENAQNVHYKKVMELDIRINELKQMKSKLQTAKPGAAAAAAAAAAAGGVIALKIENDKTPVRGRPKEKKEKEERIVPEKTLNELQEELSKSWLEMQNEVNMLVDSTKNAYSSVKTVAQGIKQLLERKHGLFRMHMMGKRVNFSCRSVISPDVNLNTNEIGIPDTFATVLTYPEPVNAYNFEEMRQAVINGPEIHPGANFILDENGRSVSLESMDYQQRVALSKTLLTQGMRTAQSNASTGRPVATGMCKKVGRHLRTGDVVLVNRQPTLHKPSIMAHKVHVLPGGGRTIRFHYANCATYNADFDGDEINVHFPQNELGRSEGFNIAFTDLQYVGPTDGKPLRGLIQDHVGSGVLLTKRDTFVTPEQYQQLLFSTLNSIDPNVIFDSPVPAILKGPKNDNYDGGALYTGKQVVTGILNSITKSKPGLNMVGTTKVPVKYCGDEGDVIFQNNELVCGILDKNQFGASSYGLVHSVNEIYGPETAGLLLSTLGRLFSNYLQSIHGFTCGIDDMILTGGIESQRTEIISGSYDKTIAAVSRFAEFKKQKPDETELRTAVQAKLRNPDNLKLLDQAVMGTVHPLSSKILETCLPAGQLKPFPHNNMSLMTQSGAKGSIVNFSQITCLLGQQELEGKRVPLMASGKSLPCFRKYDPNPRAGGYVTDRFLTGIRPQEYYFHCMAGREGLVDTAVKTSRSGYLQRCLVKHLESLMVGYDYTVRDSEGSVIQFRYGEDSIDVLRAPYLEKFEFMAANYKTLIQSTLSPGVAMEKLDYKAGVAFINQHRAKMAAAKALVAKSGSDRDKRRDVADETPLNALNPGLFGVTSDRWADKLDSYLKSNTLPDPTHLTATKFSALMKLNYMKCLAQPGESVGVIAAQSVGEPSTQMTLNTFHLAGHGGANVTLGIPRLREILMTASAKISTPIMELPVHAGKGKEAGDEVARRLSRAVLKDWLLDVRVKETMDAQRGDRLYIVKLIFRSLKDAAKAEGLSWRDFERAVEVSFVPRMNATVKAALRKLADAGDSISQRKVKSVRAAPKSGDGEADEKEDGKGEDGGKEDDAEGEGGGDDDADMESAKANAKAAPFDEADDEDESAIMKLHAEAKDGDAALAGDVAIDEATEKKNARDAKAKRKAARAKARAAAATGEIDETGDIADVATGAPAGGADLSSSSDDDSDADVAGAAGLAANKSLAADVRRSKILEKCSNIRSIEFGRERLPGSSDEYRTAIVTINVPLNVKKLLLMGMTESVCMTTLIRSTPGIGQCFVMERNREDVAVQKGVSNKETYIQTDGVNFAAIWAHADLLDLHRIMTNDIHAVLRTYGVEAARASIVKQVGSVFKVYSIAVSNRHLGLIADYMTFMGGFRPLSRIGIESNASPFQKITFETSVAFLKNACLGGDRDFLTAPSSRLVVGRPIASGTGAFDLHEPLSY